MNIEGAIFDLDGTLLDSMWVWEYVDREFLKKRGLPVQEDYLKVLGPMGFPKAAVYTKEFFGLEESPEEISREWYLLAKSAYDNEVMLKDGAFDYLKMLKSNGVKLAVATSNNEDLFSAALKRCGIYDFFDAFTTTAEVGRSKAFPDIYLLAAERIGSAPEKTAVFEDIAAGIKGAAQGGFITVGVREKTSYDDEEEIKQSANRYIESFMELM